MFSSTETSLQKLALFVTWKLGVVTGSNGRELSSAQKVETLFNEESCVAFLQYFHCVKNSFLFPGF